MHPRWHASGNDLALRHFNEVGSLYKPSCKNSRKRQKWQQAGSLLKKCWYDLKIFEAGTEWENTKGLHNQVLLPRAPSHDKKSTLCPMPLTTQHSNAAKFTLHKFCKRNCTCCESVQVGEGSLGATTCFLDFLEYVLTAKGQRVLASLRELDVIWKFLPLASNGLRDLCPNSERGLPATLSAASAAWKGSKFDGHRDMGYARKHNCKTRPRALGQEYLLPKTPPNTKTARLK